MKSGPVCHILSISGGKDSAALAIFMRGKVPDIEYVFCDTEKELPETYDYLGRLEAVLGKPIKSLKHDGRGFDHWLDVYRGYLPSARMRWCTRHLKLQPFELYVGDAPVYNYVGIRADEEREGYISTKPNITPIYPFRQHGLVYSDVKRILELAGIGEPPYRKWRSRSGCYFCFFQQKIEWVGLLENHPDLYRMASNYEKADGTNGKRFTWCDRESLQELARPERISAIKAEFRERMDRGNNGDRRLAELFETGEGTQPCLICTL